MKGQEEKKQMRKFLLRRSEPNLLSEHQPLRGSRRSTHLSSRREKFLLEGRNLFSFVPAISQFVPTIGLSFSALREVQKSENSLDKEKVSSRFEIVTSQVQRKNFEEQESEKERVHLKLGIRALEPISGDLTKSKR